MELDPAVTAWVRSVAGGPGTAIRGLRDGGAPWLVEVEEGTLVLRVGAVNEERAILTEVAALTVAAKRGIPVPRVVASSATAVPGTVLLLLTTLPGTSTIPPVAESSRLRMLGRVAARIHANSLAPTGMLPRRTHSIPDVDFASQWAETGGGQMRKVVERAALRRAPENQETVFIHGDLWHGNTMWEEGILTGLIDWDCAGVGAPGVDLGSLRCDAAMSYGPGAEEDILAGWEEAAGRPARDVAYWDLIGAMSTPWDIAWFATAISGQGRPDLTKAILFERRNLFLDSALSRAGE